ncbi:MAG: 2-oxoacid:acceptor oxidoreductase family protein [Clostridia bacterium]|nr:2-oxoacid:acceptor oxidoreductase family protein [Clostridia bacterium]
MTTQILIAGFGGQGVLFSGKFLAYKAMMEEREVSWLPSYGPEMRGGTANCSVIVSDAPVGSPIVTKPDVLIAMNLPSLDKYENAVAPGGIIIVDSTLIARKVERTDVAVYYIPATQMASDEGITTLANMIILGKLIRVCDAVSNDNLEAALKKVVSARRADMLDLNKKAIELGFNYAD